ncbi:right-handed parallel beta-helix repeat-containing protein [Pontibacter sp. 172403-2]|uniref:right-handed parallel beta-helix repeat-containing protein n=1 Tax=Pontibacter rufus TaxID=2791028 RepID=UPI0018B00F48|nr:right-handed parallel beta-helix repeat-containing protein [Pontibacter sp. 172403-2]MBF9255114.1 right-handed parallel beta-helix repeat-containing protein [Pontibacter sp. 172403-2]
MFRFILSLWLLLLTSGSLQAATYYISALGKDSNSGTSPAKAWASIAKVNSTQFAPGDTILFEGGKTFTGGIYFGTATAGAIAKVKGTPANPITLSSYGTDRAIISSGASNGFRGYNTAGFRIKNLVFKGPGRTSESLNGIEFYTDIPDTLLSYISIANVEIYGYKNAGIIIGSWDELTAGFGSVTISDSKVHDNGDAGITSYAQGRLVHKNFIVRNNKVYNNAGQPDKTESHSGNGIVLGDVDGAVIEYCEAYNNGWLNASPSNGPVGIWGYRCNNLVIQYNESHHNRTGTTKDGGGFDLDGGCTNSIMQYNYSHDNEGAGFLLAQYKDAPLMKGITVRYNISENDGRRNNYGAIHLWSTGANGGIQDLDIYNNTVYVTPATNASPKAIMVQSGGFKDARIRNNIFQVTGELEIVRLDSLTDVRFEGNDYWSADSTFKIYWADTTYSSLGDWRSATRQEQHNGVASGYSLNPELADPGKGVTIGDPKLLHTLTGYTLLPSSALIGKGLDLKELYGIDPGDQDFFGNDITGLTYFSIGGHQPDADAILGVDDTAANPTIERIITYPNPVRDHATIRFYLDKNTAFSLDVYDLRGTKIRRIGASSGVAGNIYQYNLDSRNFAEGIYLVRLVTGNRVRTAKVLVQK